MNNDLKNIDDWIKNFEDYNLEFKEAKNSFSRNKDLPNYCAALSNEGGGKLILGVNHSGRIVGTRAFEKTYNKLSNYLLDKIKIRVDVKEYLHSDGRLLVFFAPPYTPGNPVKSNGVYWMRAGESLVEMDDATLRQKLNEVNPDFSAKNLEALTIKDFDDTAIKNFKKEWLKKSRRKEYLEYSTDKIFKAIGLLDDKGFNYASLILFGKAEKISEILPGSEIIFEWRQDPDKITHDFRKTWRNAFFLIYKDIWRVINDRNIRIPFQEGLIQREVYAFSEKPIREAIINAVAHRDYSINQKSIFIKASPREFSIESPGGFPSGITIDNVLYEKAWRNRKISEIFEKAGLAERSGQGMDDIFDITIREGKGRPDLSDTDDFSVRLKIPARVKDRQFILFLEKISKEKQILFSFEEIYELERIREEHAVRDIKFRQKFLDLGIVERVGRTRGARYILSHNYYLYEGKTGIHTKVKGISRDKCKELIMNHLAKNKKGFFADFKDVFPELKPMDISNLLRELRTENKIFYTGSGASGYWRIKIRS